MVAVTFSAAVFPMIVSVADELLSALLTCEHVISLSVHLTLVRIPPEHPAPVRTELTCSRLIVSIYFGASSSPSASVTVRHTA